jgi:hypothetical protein
MTTPVRAALYVRKVPARTRHPRQDAATPGYRACRAKSGLGQFLQISLAHAAALVFGLFFPTSDAMVSTLAALSVYALGYAIELIQRQ